MRIPPEHLLRAQSDGLQRLIDEWDSLILRLRELEFVDRHVEQMIRFVKRVVHLEGILKYGLDLPPELTALTPRHLRNVPSVVDHTATRGFDHTQQQPRQSGLATSTLSGNRSDRWAIRRYRERNIVRGYCDVGSTEHPTAEHLGDVLEF